MASLGPVVSRCTRPGLRPGKRLLRLEGEEFCEPYLVLGKATEMFLQRNSRNGGLNSFFYQYN